MMKAVMTFEDAGDEVKLSIDFGEGGPNESSGAHQMAAMAMSLLQQRVSNMQGTISPQEETN
jgi:hypothetical protein